MPGKAAVGGTKAPFIQQNIKCDMKRSSRWKGAAPSARAGSSRNRSTALTDEWTTQSTLLVILRFLIAGTRIPLRESRYRLSKSRHILYNSDERAPRCGGRDSCRRLRASSDSSWAKSVTFHVLSPFLVLLPSRWPPFHSYNLISLILLFIESI